MFKIKNNLMTEEAPQRDYSLREVFNGLRWLARDYERPPETLIGLHFLALPS